MTDEELRKMDLLVAEKVMGYVWYRYAGHPQETGEGFIEASLCEPNDWEKTYDKGKDGQRGRYMLDDGKYPREEWPSRGRVPLFTRDREKAMTIVDKMGTGFALNYVLGDKGKPVWLAAFKDFGVARGETAAIAICLAGLKAVGCEMPIQKIG